MSFDRDDTLRKAEKLLRQGRLDAAIVEYARVVEDQPRDWVTTNTLGDLYVRAGQTDKAIAQYSRMAEHFRSEGFYSKAAALYKKLLKLNPQAEAVLLNLADVSHQQGLLADAKAYLNSVAVQRRNRGDHAGAAEIAVRLGSIDPSDFDARRAAARILAEQGDAEGAASRFRALSDDLAAKGRDAEARDALGEAIRLNPADTQARALAAKSALATRDLEAARTFLDREIAGDDPHLLLALVEIEALAGNLDDARALVPQLLAAPAVGRARVLELAMSLLDSNPDAAYSMVEAVVDALEAARAYDEAAKVLREFVTRMPDHVAALVRLIEVCVDGGFEAATYEAQAALADAYLKAGQASEARVIAEDLVAREPWENAHLERFRRALVMLKVDDPDAVIADRLSGHSPFTAADLFGDAAPRADPPAERAEQAGGAGLESAVQDPPVPDAGRAAGSTAREATVPDPQAGEWGRERLEQVFKDFRAEVQGTDQSVQHMTLARTYLEMGMPDAAIGSLEVASRATRFRFEAASLLGRIYKDRGESALAIEWLERAAEAPAPTVDESRALLYDLGTLFEATGETSRALAIFLELQSDAGEYRDIAGRIERLTRVETGG